MRGIENLLIDLIEEPQFVNDLLDGITEVHIRFMDTMVKYIPIDAYFGGDDMCDQRGCIMGEDRWREFFKPRLKKIVEHCHSLGLPYVLHSCGNVLPLVDDLMEIGVDGLESLQPEAMNVYELKEKTAGKMVLIGGMGVQKLLYFGTPDEIKLETARLIDELGKGGGYIISPAKALDGEPAENAAAFIEALTGQAQRSI